VKRILIVDDEFGLGETLCDLLSIDGYEATSAWSGQLALAKVAEQPPDLILLDIMMPIMDGHEVLRTLKANPAWQSIPVIMMSAAAVLDKSELALAAGFLRKPFDFDQLLRLIRALIGKSG
jgi:DNA-binding response OmpR family regulator